MASLFKNFSYLAVLFGIVTIGIVIGLVSLYNSEQIEFQTMILSISLALVIYGLVFFRKVTEITPIGETSFERLKRSIKILNQTLDEQPNVLKQISLQGGTNRYFNRY